MDCRQAERLFDLYLDKEITVSDFAAFRQHLVGCMHCTENWLATRKAADLLSSLPSECPGPEILSGIMVQLPRVKHRRLAHSFNLTMWQAGAAIVIGFALVGTAFLSGSRQMIAAVVENRGGRMVVVPRPGRPLVIPPGARIIGDLRVEGDAYVLGKVEGELSVRGRVRTSRPAGFWMRMGRSLIRFWHWMTGGISARR